ncbi:hypothetical protein GCM10012275_32470 [Longimycelium tulufanense]|uniref:non-specific serine/threonine protein kinase n=1 Tax=Longimycelium tulufanense TaxID=907463 RepID=A0A8J3CF03_9PSEU|nr:serine/threonine-protein kinase [Longimycelium tulufanense]GGM58804.1 hypothetical protein GCM10012275_32470 [Longimycelium tulufanense]
MSDGGRLVAGRYRLLERIGSGAMGIVWQAHDERLHRTVAVKQLLLQPGLSRDESEEARQRAMREARIAARLQHPNAIGVFDVVEEDGAPCLVMEYLPSRSLAAVMAEQGQLSPQEAARIGAHIANALTAAHAAGIIHRDIKPGNILLGEDGAVKITDFGISRATGDVTVTKTGMLAGTPAYLAPEVARGRDIGPPSDVFSLGSTIYATIEGEPPFGLNENTLALLHAVAAGKVNPPKQAGPLTALLMRLLRAEPEDRPTMAQARDALQAVADGKPVPAGALEPTTVVPPWRPTAATQAVPTTAMPGPVAPPGRPPHTPTAGMPVPPVQSQTRMDPRATNRPNPTRVAEVPPVRPTAGRPAAAPRRDPHPSLPSRPAAAPKRSPKRPVPRRSGWLYLAALVVAAVVGVLIASSMLDNPSGGAGGSSSTNNGAEVSNADQAREKSIKPGPANSPEEAVSEFYQAMPDVDLAWTKLDLNGRLAMEQTRGWWTNSKKVEILKGPSRTSNGQVTVLIRIHRTDGGTEDKRMYHKYANEDGGWLINNFKWEGTT